MPHELPELPYAQDALEPYISKETLMYHHGKHHAAYVKNLNQLIQDTPFANASLDQIVLQSEGGVFNNAAQVWNHTFYWHSLSPQGGDAPTGALADAIDHAFGSFGAFKQQFTEAGMKRFGSGWVWLVKTAAGELDIVTTGNAGNPLTDGLTPLLTCDVWEHAYYIDTRNDRGQYLSNFWQLVNWDFAAQSLDQA